MYPEVCNPQQAVKELSATGYLCLSEDIAELHDGDMKDLLSMLTVSELRDILCTLKKRHFVLNGEQDLSTFLLLDLGIVMYPTYNCIISEQIFPSKSDLLAYEEAIEVAQVMDQSLDGNNYELVLRCIMIAESHMSSSPENLIDSTTPELMAIFLSFFSASWVYFKVILLGISFLEHEHRLLPFIWRLIVFIQRE